LRIPTHIFNNVIVLHAIFRKNLISDYTLQYICFVLADKSCMGKKSDERNAAIDSLLEVGYQHVLNIQIDSAVYYATDALRLSEAARYSAGITRSCYQLGEMLMASANYSKALTYFARASKEKYGIQSALYQAQIQKQIGQIYTYLKLHELAIKEFHKSLKSSQKIERPDYKDYISSQVYESLAHLFTVTENRDSTLFYLKKNKILIDTMDESFAYPNLINVYTSLGYFYLGEEQVEKAATYLQLALQVAEKYDFPYVSRTYMYWSDIESLKGNFDRSIDYLQKAVINLQQTNLKGELPDVYERLSDKYARAGQADLAQMYKNKALQTDNEITKEKLDLSNQTLTLIKEEEKDALKRKLALYTSFLVILSAVIVGLYIYFLYRKRCLSRKIYTPSTSQAMRG
jgi:tetratricopeptide (TPR) repeat protein